MRYIGNERIDRAYIGDDLWDDNGPDFIVQVTGTEPLQLKYNDDLFLGMFEMSENNYYYQWSAYRQCLEGYSEYGRKSHVLEFTPDENGMVKVYFPERVLSVSNMFDPTCFIDDGCEDWEDGQEPYGGLEYYFNRIKKIYGFGHFLKKHKPINLQEILWGNAQVEFVGDYTKWDTSNCQLNNLLSQITHWKTDVPAPVYSKMEGEDYSCWDYSEARTFVYQLQHCQTKTLDLSKYNFNLNKLTQIFISEAETQAKSSLETIDFSTFDFSKIKRININGGSIKSIIYPPNFDTSHMHMISIFRCPKVEEWPEIDATNCRMVLFGANINLAVKKASLKNTQNVQYFNCFLQMTKITELPYPLDCRSARYFWNWTASEGYNAQIQKLTLLNLGTPEKFGYNYSEGIKQETENFAKEYEMRFCCFWHWGEGSEENRKTLVDSLLTYSCDRAAKGYHTIDILLQSNALARLTEDEKAAITAKGYNLIGV